MSTISGLGGTNATWDTRPSGATRKAAQDAQRLAELDSDGSGGVDATELSAWMAQAGASGDGAELLKQMDRDSDGSLSSDELSQGLRALLPPPASTLDFAQTRRAANDEDDPFAALDADGDGQLSRAEFEAGAPPQARGPGGPPPVQGGAAASAGASSTASTDDPLDVNHDGTVSQIERLAGQLQELAKAGAGDGAQGVNADIAALAQKLYDQISRNWLQPGSEAPGVSTTA